MSAGPISCQQADPCRVWTRASNALKRRFWRTSPAPKRMPELADAYSLLADYGLMSPAEAAPKAPRRLRGARWSWIRNRARPKYPWPLCARCSNGGGTKPRALYHSAIAASPGYSRARHWFGLDFLALRGRCEEALSEVLAAHDLDPLSMIIREELGLRSRDVPRFSRRPCGVS